jgi:hypothetical protein
VVEYVDFAQEQVVAFSASVDKHLHRWRQDHVRDASKAAVLEAALAQGIGVYKMLDKADRRWHLLMATGKSPRDQAATMNGLFDTLFDSWLKAARFIDMRVSDYESRGFSFPATKEFRVMIVRAESAVKDR